MARAYESIPRTVALAIGLAAVSAVAAAGGTAPDGARRTTNSFTLLTAPTAPHAAGPTPSPGTGIASSKAIILNPYHVPLIQNAGSLGSGR
jgi:hypothetical protein